ncbi:MAG: IPExxxVDY family protein [Bacteroidota bacterium]|nr:IPExxxVDY family protein [Bacteroidota bacterium]
MTITKLNLEDSFSEEFSLLAIHTDLEDFRLAYFLNKTLDLNLSRKEFDLNFIDSKGNFSVFEYIDLDNFLKWNLISNIYNHNFTTNISNDLFELSNELVKKFNLLSEYKNVNFLLKLENNENQVDLEDIIKEIKNIPQIITLYNINKDLKNKGNLIFL